MRALHWFEAKQLDRVTNYSARIEIIKAAINQNIEIQYYCSYSREKHYFNLRSHINYLGISRNRFVKNIVFNISVMWEAVQIIFRNKYNVIVVNPDLIKHMLPANMLNHLLKRENKFIVDVRTIPVNPDTFTKDIINFHKRFKFAVRYLDGFSFITPFMEKYLLEKYTKPVKTVNWSSGVDVNTFNPESLNLPLHSHKRFKLFYHGGISISRGNLDLIKACEGLVKEGYKIELEQVGILVDKSIQKYIESNGLEDWCHIIPPVNISDIPQMISDCDLPVLPFPYFIGWRVSSPIKLMEYLAMGKKVVAPKMESFTDVFGEKSNLVYYFDAEKDNNYLSIKKTLNYIIDNNLIELNQFYPESRELVLSNYTWEKQADNLFKFCNSLWIQ